MDPRDVQQVVDHTHLRRRVAIDDVERALEQLRVGVLPIDQDPGPPQHRVERVAHFVGNGGQEFVLGAQRFFGRDARQLLHFDALPQLGLAGEPVGDVFERGDGADHLVAVRERADPAALGHFIEPEIRMRRWQRQDVPMQAEGHHRDPAGQRLAVGLIDAPDHEVGVQLQQRHADDARGGPFRVDFHPPVPHDDTQLAVGGEHPLVGQFGEPADERRRQA